MMTIVPLSITITQQNFYSLLAVMQPNAVGRWLEVTASTYIFNVPTRRFQCPNRPLTLTCKKSRLSHQRLHQLSLLAEPSTSAAVLLRKEDWVSVSDFFVDL